MIGRRCRAAVLAVLLVVALAACGDDDSADANAPNGLADARAATAAGDTLERMREYDDYTFRGRAVLELGGARAAVDAVWIVRPGKACQVSAQAPEFGKIVIRRIGKRVFVSGNDAGWRRSFGLTPAEAAGMQDRWLRFRLSRRGVAGCEMDQMFPRPRATAGFRGTAAVDVRGNPGRRLVTGEGRNRLALVVATSGTPRVLQVAGRDEDGPYRLTLLGTDLGTPLDPPRRSEVIDGGRYDG